METFPTTINAVLFHGPEDIEIIPIRVTEQTYRKVIKKLQSERQKMIGYLRELESNGLIKSIWRPKNKQLKAQLKELVKIKKDMKKNIEKLKVIYQ